MNMLSRHLQRAVLLLALLLAGCDPGTAPTAAVLLPTVAPTQLATPSAILTPSATATATATLTPSATRTPSATLTPSVTAVPLEPTATLAPVSGVARTAIFNQLWQLVRDRYVYEDYGGSDWEALRAEFQPQVAAATSEEAFYDLLRELIGRLGDEHSRFESPQEVAAEAAQFDGELRYAGIGAVIRTVPEGGLITRLAQGSPAEQAGLLLGDLVLVVAGHPFTDTAAFGPNGPVAVIRGDPGSVVELTVRSPDSPPRKVAITRQAIPSSAFPQVEARRLPDSAIGLLRIDTFYSAGLDEQVREQIELLAQQGPLAGLVVDVRENGGGRLDLMLNTLALFIDGGSIGSSKGRIASSQLRIPAGKVMPQLADVPVVVLIGEGSASAAEMFAAGMQLLGRASIVGVASAGNTENLVQHGFSDGSRLWLAELAYRLPDGTLIEGRGVLPNREVAPGNPSSVLAPTSDPQVQTALEELSAATEAVIR